MKLMDLDELIHKSQMQAGAHPANCAVLLVNNQLAVALDYCTAQGVEPPQCSLTAMSANADKMRAIAKGMLSDEAWWKKRLKIKAVRDFERDQIKRGSVTNIVSDGILDHKDKR